MAIIVAAVALLPSVAASFAASAIRDAVRRELPDSATVESTASIGWSSPLGAIVEVRDGSEVEATLAISTPRGMLGWIGPVLGGSIGDVPVSFSMTARLEGEKGRALLDRLRGNDEASAASADSSVGATSRPVGETSGLPEGLSIAASGSIVLGIVDAERGVDLAIRSDRLELALLADRSLEAAIELRIGRVGDGRDLDGRLDLEVALSDALAADGSISWAKALGAISIEARELDFDWDGRDVSISSLRASAASDEASGLSLAARAEGSIDGELGTAEADLSWTAPFAEDGSLRRDLAGLGGTARLSGFPSAVVAAMVPTPYGELFADLGSSFRAEIAVPKEQDAALVATLEMEHLRGEASARLDRTTGEIVDGRVEFAGAPSRRKVISALGVEGSGEGSGWSRLPLAISIEGLELLGGQDLRVANAKATLEPAGSLLSDLVPYASIADDRPLTLGVAAVRWRLGDGLPMIEARGLVEFDGIVSLDLAEDRPSIEVADTRLEWFAEPLGKALSIRGRAEVAGGSLRFEERFDGLWTGSGWIPASDLRPHGNLSIERIAAAELEPWMPESVSPVWAAQGFERLSLQLGTRVEGDRLEGAVQVSAQGLALNAPVSLDSQRLAIGATAIDLSMRPEAIAAMPEDWRGAWALLGPTPISIGVEPIVLSAAALAGGGFSMPAITVSLAMPNIAVESASSSQRIAARDLQGSLRRGADGSIDMQAATTLDPSILAMGEGADASIRATRPFAISAKARRKGGEATAIVEGLVVETGPIELEIRSADSASLATIAQHRASVDPLREGGGYAMRLAPADAGDAAGATVRFDGSLMALDAGGWAIDGEGGARAVPAAITSVFASDHGLVGRALGASLDVSVRATALAKESGEISISVEGERGRLDLPRLLVEPEVLRIPVEPAFSGQVAFTPELLGDLDRLNPMLGQLESMAEPIRIRMWECAIPRAGVGSDRLDGNLRVDLGRGRFVPSGVLENILLAFGDASASGFDGFADPLIATMRRGQLAYDDFAVRFVPYEGGWRNTLRFAGRIDLVRSPAYGEFTGEYPASSLSAYSAEIRKLPPDLLESLTVPMTLYGPLDGSGLELRIDFDFGKLIEQGLKAGVREGARRLFEDLLGPKK